MHICLSPLQYTSWTCDGSADNSTVQCEPTFICAPLPRLQFPILTFVIHFLLLSKMLLLVRLAD